MELVLIRTYFPDGTNGTLFYANSILSYTIELPWLHNAAQRSCIPEGRYRLKLRHSPKYKKHLLVEGVPGRALILVHPANNAQRDLKGCIAPVNKITEEGKGTSSRIAIGTFLT